MTVETHICNSKAFIVLHKHADVAVPRFLKGLNLQQIPLIKKRKSELLQICQLHIHHIPKMQNYRVWWMCSSCLSLCYGAFVWQSLRVAGVLHRFWFHIVCGTSAGRAPLDFCKLADTLWPPHLGWRHKRTIMSVFTTIWMIFQYRRSETYRYTEGESLQKPKHSKSLGFQFWLLLLL